MLNLTQTTTMVGLDTIMDTTVPGSSNIHRIIIIKLIPQIFIHLLVQLQQV